MQRVSEIRIVIMFVSLVDGQKMEIGKINFFFSFW